MGVFDSVFVRCPRCGDTLEFQSKEYCASQNVFGAQSVPLNVAEGVDGDVKTCNCGARVKVSLPTEIPVVHIALVVAVEGEEDQGDW